MTIEEDIRRMSNQTLGEYKNSYQRALDREGPGPRRDFWQQTLELINAEQARRTPLVPLLPSDETAPF